MDTSRKKVFWLRAQPLMHRLLHLFIGPERLASHHLFELSKDMKVTGGEVRWVWPMWKTLKGQILDCSNSWTGSMEPSIVLQDYPSFIPKESQHNLSHRWLCAWPGWGESVTELVPFMNFLVHSYTCCSDRHASPYWIFIRPWISMGFIPPLLKKRKTERSSPLVHVAGGATIFTLLLRCHVAFLHLTTTCRPLFKLWASLLSTYKTIELCLEFLSHF